MFRSRLAFNVIELKSIAAKKGPLHGYWDDIFEFEAALNDQKTAFGKTIEEYYFESQAILDNRGKQ